MTRRLGVIQTPSLTEAAWATAITERAKVMGIGVLDVRDGTVPEDVDRQHYQIVLAVTSEAAEAAIEPTDWLVIRDTPAIARWLTAAASGEAIESRAVQTTCSHRLALAEMVAAVKSALVIDAAELAADVPVLGHINREETQWTGPSPNSDPGPLAMLQSGATAEWPLSLFYYPRGDDLEAGSPDFDLTGRARILMFGPYIHLPPGSWGLDVQLEIDPQHREVPIKLEWGAGADYVEVDEAVDQAGLYTITMKRDWQTVEAAQFRLWLTQARFQGHLRVLSCRVRRLPDTSIHQPVIDAAALVDPLTSG